MKPKGSFGRLVSTTIDLATQQGTTHGPNGDSKPTRSTLGHHSTNAGTHEAACNRALNAAVVCPAAVMPQLWVAEAMEAE